MVVGLQLAEGVGGVFEVLERRAVVAAGDLGGEQQEPLAQGRVDLLEERRAAFEVEARIGPARLGEFHREAEEGQAVVVIELLEDVRRRGEAGRRQLVAVARELIDEEDEAGSLADAGGRGTSAGPRS